MRALRAGAQAQAERHALQYIQAPLKPLLSSATTDFVNADSTCLYSILSTGIAPTDAITQLVPQLS